MARLLTGEVFLTTRMREILGHVGFVVMSGDLSVAQGMGEAELAETAQFRGLAKAQDFPLVEGAGKFDHQAGGAFGGRYPHRPLDFVRYFESDSHGEGGTDPPMSQGLSAGGPLGSFGTA